MLSYDLAETCVFGKQSPGPGHCDPLSGAPLLPKLRGHFAEFLRESCLAPLGILYLPTCVGFGYRLLPITTAVRAFLGSSAVGVRTQPPAPQGGQARGGPYHGSAQEGFLFPLSLPCPLPSKSNFDHSLPSPSLGAYEEQVQEC